MKRAVAAVLFLGAALVVWQSPVIAAEQMRPDTACGFSVILSPLNQMSRRPETLLGLRLVSQPDSPVAVTSVSFPFLLLPVPPPPTQTEIPFVISVMNVSDRLVRGVQLYVQARSSSALIAGGPRISRALGPGERAIVRSDGALARRMLAVASADAHFLVAVESVEFAECVYRPSQAPQVFEKQRR
jgi:hypothetical protein